MNKNKLAEDIQLSSSQNKPSSDNASSSIAGANAVMIIKDSEKVEFNGLTKEELQQYINDPFWVKTRKVLFILFWICWLAMLISACVIIAQAPSCKPPPELDWMQMSPMLQYEEGSLFDIDGDGRVDSKDFLRALEILGFSSVYIPNLISEENYEQLNKKYSEDIFQLIEEVAKNEKKTVTDFFPRVVSPEHPWKKRKNQSQIFSHNLLEVNFAFSGIVEEMQRICSTWIRKHVFGFIFEDIYPKEEHVRDSLNEKMIQDEGAVGSRIITVTENMTSLRELTEFIQNNVASISDIRNWAYLKYNPGSISISTEANQERLILTSLFLVPTTPILIDIDRSFLLYNETIDHLMTLREHKAFQVGEMVMANFTDEDMIAFVRLVKGAPGYAVLINMGTKSTDVDLQGISGVSESGRVEVDVYLNESVYHHSENIKVSLWNVTVPTNRGMIVEFVPNF